MDQAIGFEEVRWLQELNVTSRKGKVPEAIESRLLTRGLVERRGSVLALTARGRIALAKLA